MAKGPVNQHKAMAAGGSKGNKNGCSMPMKAGHKMSGHKMSGKK